MPLTPPYAHVKLNYSQEGIRPYINDFWFSITGTFSGSWNVANACIAMQSHFQTNMLAVMNGNVEFLGTDLLVNNAGIVATSSDYTSAFGALSNIMVPAEVAAVVRLQSSAAGKVGRGRIFLSGLDSTMVDGGRINAAHLGLFNTIATTMQTSVVDQGVTYHPAVYSRKDNILYNVQYCTAEQPLGTQRRRRTLR